VCGPLNRVRVRDERAPVQRRPRHARPARGAQRAGADGIVPDGVPYQPSSAIPISLSGDDEPTLRGYDEALSEGGTVVEPLARAPWGDQFGACIDRIGTSWMVNIGSAPP